jgi:hypothetical protein
MTASPPSTSGTSTSTCNPYGSFLRGILAEISAMRGLRISRYYAEPGRGYTPSDKSGRDCGADQLVALRSWVTIQCISFPRTRLAVERWIRRGALLRMLKVARVSIDFTVEDVVLLGCMTRFVAGLRRFDHALALCRAVLAETYNGENCQHCNKSHKPRETV